MNKKRGQISPGFMVGIVVVLISLVVLVLIFTQLDFGKDLDREICHDTAVIRATIPGEFGGAHIIDNTKDAVDLKCKTKRLCISTEKEGKCEEEFGQEFITERIKTSYEDDSELHKRLIRQTIAREMADCWNMMGEGKLEVFNKETKSLKYSTAGVVCTRIMFDETITANLVELNGMSNYLLTHKEKNSGVSYWDYFRDTQDGDTLQVLSEGEITGDVLNLNEQKAILYVEMKASALPERIGQLVGLTGSFFLFKGVAGKGLNIVGGKAFGALISGVAAVATGNLFDKWYKENVSPLGEDDSVSGLFLIDYTKEGFITLTVNEDNQKNFYLANIP